MINAGVMSTLFVMVAVAAHYISIAVALYRSRRIVAINGRFGPSTPVSILRPVCGVDQYDGQTLTSGFLLDHPNYELLFCGASASDPAAGLVKSLICRFEHADAHLFIGDDRPTPNPKLNNLVKAWPAAQSPWIVFADSNVMMPADYLDQLFAAWRDNTGLVCSPPVGSRPEGFWAEIECAFLNTYQARWQLAADYIGFGFAQGKSMLWRRDVLDRAGGILALGSEIAEDAAATKVVRQQGLRVRLVDRPFKQPLGYRTARQVWDRQLRWARLRRATFTLYYVAEIATGIAPPLIAAAFAIDALDADPRLSFAALIAAWYLPEAFLNVRAGWHFSPTTPLAWLARDLLIPIIWMSAWFGRGFEWRGNAMTTADSMTEPAIHRRSEPLSQSR